jgi:hypothetical protein
VLVSNIEDRRHVGRLPVQMHRQDRLGPWCNRPLDQFDVDQIVVGIRVDQHRRRARVGDRQCRGDKSVGGRNHFVARTNAQRPQRQGERGGSVGDAETVFAAAKLGKRLLEVGNLVAEDELTIVDRPLDGQRDFSPYDRVLHFQINKRNRHSAKASISEE